MPNSTRRAIIVVVVTGAVIAVLASSQSNASLEAFLLSRTTALTAYSTAIETLPWCIPNGRSDVEVTFPGDAFIRQAVDTSPWTNTRTDGRYWKLNADVRSMSAAELTSEMSVFVARALEQAGMTEVRLTAGPEKVVVVKSSDDQFATVHRLWTDARGCLTIDFTIAVDLVSRGVTFQGFVREAFSKSLNGTTAALSSQYVDVRKHRSDRPLASVAGTPSRFRTLHTFTKTSAVRHRGSSAWLDAVLVELAPRRPAARWSMECFGRDRTGSRPFDSHSQTEWWREVGIR